MTIAGSAVHNCMGPFAESLWRKAVEFVLILSCYFHGEHSSHRVGPKSDRANQDSDRGSTVRSMVRRLKLFIH